MYCKLINVNRPFNFVDLVCVNRTKNKHVNEEKFIS